MDVQKQTVQLILLFFTALIGLNYLDLHNKNKKSDPIINRISDYSDAVQMPLVLDSDPVTSRLFWGAPQEDRSPTYRKYLAASVKISVGGGMGSGTLVYYDSEKNVAYVTSCGHLWNGSRSAQELKRNPVKCQVITWYHNSTKLPQPKNYPADVLFWSNNRGYDCSLVKFTPDWEPNFFPIAPTSYELTPGSHYHSVGCDGGREVARYDVEIVGYRGADLITTRNSPRPGRSGGGLLSEDGFYVGTCWGTSDTTGGGGIGYFTPLKNIHSVYKNNGYDWLLSVKSNPKSKPPKSNPKPKRPPGLDMPIEDIEDSLWKPPSNYVPSMNNALPLP